MIALDPSGHWKHEHLIRGVRYTRADGDGRNARAGRPKTHPAPQLCAVPGCDRVLAHGGTSGVCRKHQHAAGYCRCGYCRRKANG